MSTTTHTARDEQATNYPIRLECTARWNRDLEHERDDPDLLEKRLSTIPVDGDVTVTEIASRRATVVVETTPDRMNHSPGAIETKVRRVFRAYNRKVDGDSVRDVPTPTPGLKSKHIRWAYEGKDRPTGPQYVEPEVWEEAKEKAEGLDLEGADAVNPTLTLRTLTGEVDA